MTHHYTLGMNVRQRIVVVTVMSPPEKNSSATFIVFPGRTNVKITKMSQAHNARDVDQGSNILGVVKDFNFHFFQCLNVQNDPNNLQESKVDKDSNIHYDGVVSNIALPHKVHDHYSLFL